MVLGEIPPDCKVRTTDFKSRGNKIVWGAIYEMNIRGLPIDLITVSNWLLDRDLLQYVDDIETMPSDPRLISVYVAGVREAAWKRS